MIRPDLPQVKGLFIRRGPPRVTPRPPKRNGNPCDPERIATYRRLVDNGLTVVEIAAAVGRSKWTVYSNLHRYGLRAVRGYGLRVDRAAAQDEPT